MRKNKSDLDIFIEYTDWHKVSKSFKNIPDTFVSQYKKYLDWDIIVKHNTLSEKTILKYANEIGWGRISSLQPLSECFIEKHSNEVLWDNIFTYQKLSIEFIEKHMNKLKNTDIIFLHQKLSTDFIEKHFNIIPCSNHIWNVIFFINKFPKEFTKKYAELARQKQNISR